MAEWHGLAVLILPLVRNGGALGGKRGQRVMERANLRGQKVDDEFREFFDLTGRHFIYRPSVPMLTDDDLCRLKMPFAYWAGKSDILLPTKKIARRLRRLVFHADIFIDRKGGHGYHPPLPPPCASGWSGPFARAIHSISLWE
ncbi:MAG: hypothetical protein MUC72_03960 [Acidobacteria bacterium]|jgi:pimeloyl-ACP methyl ester carboxylesterase|nr:hypothetical protein [Acidobacteriota bacterium]